MPPRRRPREDDEEEEVDDFQHASSRAGGGTSSSSSSARYSGAHTQSDQRMVSSNMQTVMLLLEALAERIQANKEGVSADVLEEWKKRIVDLAKEAGRVTKADQTYEKAAQQVVQEKFQNNAAMDNVDLQALNTEELKGMVETLVGKEMKGFKPEKDDQKVKKIIDACMKKTTNDEEEEDLYTMPETEMREADLKCPFTLQLHTKPLKNTNPGKSCIHHISPEGLDALTKNKPQGAPCPVAGCVGKWAKAYAIEDEDFKLRIQRYLRMKKARTDTADHTQTSSTVDLDD